ncbi:hypothetical protein CFELI_13125 [Corynebacterium felinum]|uniref:Uncharacterized protein n=1 Tax=Corynebacterium felinum TaxID=131318 RepID=A0ABU2B5Y5_9CORY|nr:hypothetical protein [Corynebacterium felinum]WJY96204.1 hypothetical protein CFELI_13125 [Corynebacterium felinum]
MNLQLKSSTRAYLGGGVGFCAGNERKFTYGVGDSVKNSLILLMK